MPSPVWQSATTLTAGNGASAVYTLPSSIAANDIVVLVLYKENTATVTPPAGFSQLTSVATGVGVHQQVILWKRMTGGESGTVTASWTGSVFRGGSAHRISGCVTAGDPWGTNFATNFSDVNATVTPTVSLASSPANSLLFWGATDFAGSTTTWTPPTGFSNRASDIVHDGATKDNTAGGATGSLSGSVDVGNDTMTVFIGALSSPSGAEEAPEPRVSLRLAPAPTPLSLAVGALVGPPVAMQVWAGADASVLQVAAELGSGAAAAGLTATESKVAVQSGSCTTGAVGSSTETKVTSQAGSANTAVAGTAVEKRVAPQAGAVAAAAAATAAEKKVSVQVAVSTAGAVTTSLETGAVANYEWWTFEFPLEWFPRLVWAGADEPRGPSAAEAGSAATAPAATATEKKVAVQSGSLVATGHAATSTTKKVSPSQGSAAAAAVGAAVEKKVGKESGTTATAAAGTSVETSGAVALERGTNTAAAAATAAEKKVAVQGGSCSAGTASSATSKKVSTQSAAVNVGVPAGSSVCRKVAKATGVNATATSTRAAHSKKVTQAGRLCVAAVTSCTTRSSFDSAISRISTGSRRQRASTGNTRQRITTEIG